GRPAAEAPASASGRQKRTNCGTVFAPTAKELSPPGGGRAIRPSHPATVPFTVRGCAVRLLLRRLYDTGGGQLLMVGIVPSDSTRMLPPSVNPPSGSCAYPPSRVSARAKVLVCRNSPPGNGNSTPPSRPPSWTGKANTHS